MGVAAVYVEPEDRDRIGRKVPHRMFLNALTLLQAVPQIGQVISDAPLVPASHLSGDDVLCVCGATTALVGDVLVECGGWCGRHFLLVDGVVRAARLGSTQGVDLDAGRAEA